MTSLTPTVNVTTTASATAVVALSTTPRPALTAQANTIYLGCTIQPNINAGVPRAPSNFQVVVVVGPALVNFILTGVQESYPFIDLNLIATLTNQFLSEVCPSSSTCKVINRVMFGFGTTYQNETIQSPDMKTRVLVN